MIGLATLVEHPPSSNQELRDQFVDYLLVNRALLEEGQQLGFQHGDPAFKEDGLSAYGNTHTFDLYCDLMRNPIGVQVNCEWGDAFTLSAARVIYSVNILIHSMSPEESYRATYVDGHHDESRRTLHLAHFLSKPQHFAAIGHRPPSDAEDDESPFAESSPKLTARIRDELDEMATTMSWFWDEMWTWLKNAIALFSSEMSYMLPSPHLIPRP